MLCLLCTASVHAQTILRGKIMDAEGGTLGGASVYERGTSNGTVSGLDGSYLLRISKSDATIVASFTGFTTQTIKLSGQTNLDVKLEDGGLLQQVEIVGSRSQNRTVVNTAVPVDVIDIKAITNTQGQLDINQMLHYAAPSFNANRQSGSDGSDHVDPASLRGLGPDQTLVLINGKRRHQSSLINIYGTRGRGNTGTDLNAIPAAAIERIEILRDGAAAQYGSDAIAGVINIVLKESVDEFSGNINVGAHKASNNPNRSNFDGENLQINGNYGFKVGEKGFVNITSDYWFRGHTNRTDPSLYRKQFGDAQGGSFSTFFNAKMPLNNNAAFYAFGGQSLRKSEAFAWSRSATSPRTVTSLYPDGFDPIIAADVTDRSMSTGLKGRIGIWDVDFNNTYGKNIFHYFGRGTANASLGDRSPTSFDDGGFSLSQNSTSLNFSHFFKGLFAGSNIAYGVEYRAENYEIFAGEEGSWRTYESIFSIDSTFDETTMLFTGLDTMYRPGGSQGFPGFAPSNEVNENRTNLGAYLDAEFDFTDKITLGAATRFENYSDFGSTMIGKLSGRVELAKGFALRGSAGTGFRAPSLPQVHFNSIYTDFVNGVGVDKFLAKNNSPVTRALGIDPLKQETSVNLGVGITYSMGGFKATADYYQVKIEDRIVLTSDFYNDDAEIGAILRSLNVGSARFFANAINTSTKGVDLVVSYFKQLDDKQRFSVTIAANSNNMTIDKINVSDKLKGKEDFYLSTREKQFIVAAAPKLKGNIGLDYKYGRFGTNLRATYYGAVDLGDYVGETDRYDPRTVLDLSFGYDVTSKVRLTLGGANILNAYPTKQNEETEGGGLYESVQMGFNGAFLFSRLGFKF
jgi:iron complex outermembrane recepter protein